MYQETHIGIDMYIYYMVMLHKKFMYNDMIFTMQMVVEVCFFKYQSLLEFNIQSCNLFTNAFIVDDFFISVGIAFHITGPE